MHCARWIPFPLWRNNRMRAKSKVRNPGYLRALRRNRESKRMRALIAGGRSSALRPIYTEELPEVTAHDSLFILLRRVILRSCTATPGRNKTKNRARLLLVTPQCRLTFQTSLSFITVGFTNLAEISQLGSNRKYSTFRNYYVTFLPQYGAPTMLHTGNGRQKGGGGFLSSPWIFKITGTEGCFLSFEWEKTNFTTFSHP